MSLPEAEKELAKDKSICLIDERSNEEYREGHTPGSLHLPLDRISGKITLLDTEKLHSLTR